ncbi:hypothetical protein [Nocardia amamiensis]|uniref:hypothetical protein n=1 Tax=Nocardia TaxID=1817 RepID=UPI0034050042
MDTMDTLVEPLRDLDWNDIDAVETACIEVLDILVEDPSIVRNRLTVLPTWPELFTLCEHYDILDKLVLHDDPAGFRVRLHIFLPGYFDRPHNHRWSYASRILRGQYRHYLFGNDEVDEHVDPAKLPVLQVREELVGSSYALHDRLRPVGDRGPQMAGIAGCRSMVVSVPGHTRIRLLEPLLREA